MQFLWWMRKLLFFWVKSKVVPESPKDELKLTPGMPVCYLLNSGSFSDVLVLDETCRRFGLPLPHNTRSALAHPGAAAFIYLHEVGLVGASRSSGKRPPSPLLKVVQKAHAEPSMDVQIVPVSILWGRNPGRSERSLFKLLFFDDEHAGLIQKFFILLAQGRNNLVRFGKPVSLRQVVAEGLGPEETAKKIRRVVRVHFRRQRIDATGPALPGRQAVTASLLSSRTIKTAIDEEARKKKISHERAHDLAVRYIREIACDMKPGIVRFFDILLSWMWNRMFDGIEFKHSHRLREIDEAHEIVYVPCHRSHMDYLLLSYSLYHQGMVPPHTAAGVNLDFWPAGPLLRRAGAFFIRRTFGGNRLYTAVFNEYVHYLLTKGYPMNFFIEGGRSRTGRLLAPRTGMLAMVVQSFLRDHRRKVVFLPVYIGYDKVMEVRTYQSELRGSAKRQESFGQLLKARRALKTRFGKAYIGCGEPIDLEAFLDARHDAWREQDDELAEKPRWLHPVINHLADEILTRVNATAIVNPIGLVALALLATPQRAMAEDELLYVMERLLAVMRAAPYGADVSLPSENAREILQRAMEVAKLERFQHPSGDVIFLNEHEGVLVTYYRNTILHLVTLPALVASFFQHNDRFDEKELVASCAAIYPFFRQEFFLRWRADEAFEAISRTVSQLTEMGLLVRDGEAICRADVTSRDFISLKVLSRTLGQALERYALSTALLARYADGKPFDRASFEATCLLMAQRISILSGAIEPEFFDKQRFRHYFDMLKELEFTREEGDKVILDERVAAMSEVALSLLSADLRQSIVRAAHVRYE